ncbi:hypothetical protein [Sinorhizobium meliloti]|uniref:Uncharacterized protein n=1 Tax=Rhizobium meliloti (strain 1021) TaxID=266834 RepID=Q92SB1_RHIME|nr:hypothetical protein [Sinorhizobium meliloti]AGG73079.1 hypothetical protein SM2011_c02203 [Sinorhizobium meliloti 2011]ASP57814.1 hypothetical protein CDO30_05470 [Sinorhizobium meliloti]MCK3802817.1 hypothetical protein [Sinorhizobium meliloti]MCK3808663.1 hypothetical protein [Sinorhizobium meliloti]MCK3813432.1 hypothetical protein [Sinorhizobium meliloti]
MRALIVDSETLISVTPSAMISYVTTEGWIRTDKYGEHSDVYAKAGGPELIIPGTAQLGDYAQVVAEVIDELARHENRSELQVFRDLIGSDRDVVRVRAPEADGDGSVQVDAGVNIFAQAREILLSAACSANEPRPAYRTGKNKEATAYMSRVRLGQTEHGSFVVTLFAPVPPSLEGPKQSDFWPVPAEEPFDRLVTRYLADGLQAAHKAAEQVVRGGGINAFTNAVHKGVSANLCEALSSLIDVGEGLDVSVTWSRTRPTPEARRQVVFQKSQGEVLREAARVLRLQEPRPDERLEGYIIGAGRRVEDDDGQVTLKTFVDGRTVSVKTKLPADLYTVALAAHDDKNSVALTGDLRRDGQRWRLENPRNLEVITEDLGSE